MSGNTLKNNNRFNSSTQGITHKNFVVGQIITYSPIKSELNQLTRDTKKAAEIYESNLSMFVNENLKNNITKIMIDLGEQYNTKIAKKLTKEFSDY